MSILLTGVTGNTGSLVAAGLRARGVPFRAMVRSPEVRERLARQGMTAVLGDFDEPHTLALALAERRDGVPRLHARRAPGSAGGRVHRRRPRRRRQEAREAVGVRGDVNGPSAILRAHGRLERTLVESGMDHVIVRPHGFMQTFVLSNEALIRKAGAYLLPTGEGRAPSSILRDVGRACVHAILADEHVGKAFDLTGPESLTFAEQAELLATALRRPVTYLAGSESMLDRAFAMFGVPEVAREHAKVVMRMIRNGELADVRDGLQQLGVTPTPYATFARGLRGGKHRRGDAFPIPDSLGSEPSSGCSGRC